MAKRSVADLNTQYSILHPRAAFTLIELLVVVVLVGLLATTVTVRLQGATDEARLRAATVQLEQTLRLARQWARTHHEAAWLMLEPGSARYRLVHGPQRDVRKANWQVLDGVMIARAVVRSDVGVADDDKESVGDGNVFALRITPTGATLPWALELRTGAARCVLWTDGVTGRLCRRDNVEFHALRWESEESGT